MLSLYGQEMGDERGVPMIGMSLPGTANRGEGNERATLIRGRRAIRPSLAIGGVRMPRRRCADFFKPHSNTVSIQDNEPVPTFKWQKACRAAVNRDEARKLPPFHIT
jgi:hypothetical protein